MTFILIYEFETVGYSTLRHYSFWRKKFWLSVSNIRYTTHTTSIHAYAYHRYTHISIEKNMENYKMTSSFLFLSLSLSFFPHLSQISILLTNLYLCYCCLPLSLTRCSFLYVGIVRCQMALISFVYTTFDVLIANFNFGKLQECNTFSERASERVSVYVCMLVCACTSIMCELNWYAYTHTNSIWYYTICISTIDHTNIYILYVFNETNITLFLRFHSLIHTQYNITLNFFTFKHMKNEYFVELIHPCLSPLWAFFYEWNYFVLKINSIFKSKVDFFVHCPSTFTHSFTQSPSLVSNIIFIHSDILVFLDRQIIKLSHSRQFSRIVVLVCRIVATITTALHLFFPSFARSKLFHLRNVEWGDFKPMSVLRGSGRGRVTE